MARNTSLSGICGHALQMIMQVDSAAIKRHAISHMCERHPSELCADARGLYTAVHSASYPHSPAAAACA
jgi:hypothetical protein